MRKWRERPRRVMDARQLGRALPARGLAAAAYCFVHAYHDRCRGNWWFPMTAEGTGGCAHMWYCGKLRHPVM